MSDAPKVSVIVPMYNPGKTILRGLRSLREQTLKDIEIILVDDGSREETLAGARKAAMKDQRIRILNTGINAGAGIARNRGIENACGEYLAFMDADDYISPDYLAVLYQKAELCQADISKGLTIETKLKGIKRQLQPDHAMNDSIRRGLKRGKQLYTLFTSGHCSAIYNRQWVESHKIRYGSSRYGEDTTFLLRACAAAKRIVLDDRACYYHVESRDSLSKHVTVERLNEQLKALHEQIDYLIGEFGSNIALNYELIRIRWPLGVYAAVKRHGIIAADDNTFLDELRSEVMRLPNLPALVKYSPMIGALVEYRENLCSMVVLRIEGDHEENARIESIVRCFRFASLHPERKDLYRGPLLESLERAAAYLLGLDKYHTKGVSVMEKAAFTCRLYSELRKNVDLPFCKKYMREEQPLKKICSSGKSKK